MNLSPHFTLEEATLSQEAERRGIDNSHPSQDIVEVARLTAQKMEMVRTILSFNIPVNSWIRCLLLNRALGSDDTSQHLKGEAVDFICPQFGSPLDICRKLIHAKFMVNFDQLILEHIWVHASWNSDPNAKQRNQVLSLLKKPINGRKYTDGLTNPDGVVYPI